MCPENPIRTWSTPLGTPLPDASLAVTVTVWRRAPASRLIVVRPNVTLLTAGAIVSAGGAQRLRAE
jgi:hypothetical protein